MSKRCLVLFLKLSLFFNRKYQQDVLFCFLFSFWDIKHKFHFQEMSPRCCVLFLFCFWNFPFLSEKMSTRCFVFFLALQTQLSHSSSSATDSTEEVNFEEVEKSLLQVMNDSKSFWPGWTDLRFSEGFQ